MPKVLSLAEPHTLENLVTHQIKKWLLCDYQYVGLCICAPSPNFSRLLLSQRLGSLCERRRQLKFRLLCAKANTLKNKRAPLPEVHL